MTAINIQGKYLDYVIQTGDVYKRQADNRAAGGNSIFTVCFIHWFINPDWRLHAAFVYLWQRYLPAGGAGSGTHASV